MKVLEEFKQFALKGNMLDIAVGIIIGAGFTGVVNSLVKDVITPPIGMLTGGIDFSQKYLVMKPGKTGGTAYPTLDAAAADGAITLNYGAFLNQCISFLIVAFAVFMLVRSFNKVREKFEKKQAEVADVPASMPPDIALLTEIRDLLAAAK
ncbi:MAG: large conductance mechanosensitive channel protein MscL [Fimbriimonadaceae bacterium]|nr:large conductance mechanosensitive channel protein MscL [Fimbriimonadaceae bacterium]